MFCDKRCSPGTTPLNRGDDIARERIFLSSANSAGKLIGKFIEQPFRISSRITSANHSKLIFFFLLFMNAKINLRLIFTA